MKKLFCSVLFVLLSVGLSKAQTNNRVSLSAGLEVAFPAGGNFSNSSTTGFGPTANIDYELESLPLTLTGYIGYLHFGSKSAQNNTYVTYNGASANVVPLLGGVKYYFVPGLGVYGTALLGVEFFSLNSNRTNNVASYTGVNYPNSSPSESKFTFAIGGGYELPLNIPGAVDLSARFMIISDANYFSLRAGYIYRF